MVNFLKIKRVIIIANLVFLLLFVTYLFVKPDKVIKPALKSLSAKSEFSLHGGDSDSTLRNGALGDFYDCLVQYQGISNKWKPIADKYKGGDMQFRMDFANGVSLSFTSTYSLTLLFRASLIGDEGEKLQSDVYVVRCPLSLLK